MMHFHQGTQNAWNPFYPHDASSKWVGRVLSLYRRFESSGSELLSGLPRFSLLSIISSYTARKQSMLQIQVK